MKVRYNGTLCSPGYQRNSGIPQTSRENKARPYPRTTELIYATSSQGSHVEQHDFIQLTPSGMSPVKEKLKYRHEVVDRQLAHAPISKIDRAYDRAKFLDDRTTMMQEWGDLLDKLL